MGPSKKLPLKRTLYTGNILCTPSLGQLKVLEKAVIGVDENGTIAFILESGEDEPMESARGSGDVQLRFPLLEKVRRHGWKDGEWDCVVGGNGGTGWWFPGFIDTHTHAPQYPNTGLFGSTTLLSWLQTYTYPIESSFSSLDRAAHIYKRAVSRSLAHGTTTAAYYSTVHVPATNLLAEIAYSKGQRAFVGRVCMDSDQNPDYYRDDGPDDALTKTKETIQHINDLDSDHDLITPIVTPRFAPSCTKDCLSRLGKLAKENDLPIQTHISESVDEIALVKKLFPEQASYTEVYDAHGLLTSRTVLAHGIHLSREETELIKKRGAGVSHCAISNSYLSSGLCYVRGLLDGDIKVGLGTDVSGGWSPSILTAAREAIGVSRILSAVQSQSLQGQNTWTVGGLQRAEENTSKQEMTADQAERTKLSVEEALYLATVGGARCLGLGHKVGSFEVGKEWDAQLIVCNDFSDSGSAEGNNRHGEEDDNPIEIWGKETWSEKIAKWVFTGDDRDVQGVWVQGRKMAQRPDFVLVWDLVVHADGGDMAEPRSLWENRSQCLSKEDGLWFDGIYSFSGVGAQLESHPLMVPLQKAASPASCLISLTVCTEAVMLGRGVAVSHKVRMEVPYESVRSEARDERYNECRDLLDRFEGLREQLIAARNPVSGSEWLP